MQQRLAWRALAVGSGVIAGAVTRSALAFAWKRVGTSDAPTDPASPRMSWPQALTWSITVGVAMGVSRLVAQRGAAQAWQVATGSYPEAFESSG